MSRDIDNAIANRDRLWANLIEYMLRYDDKRLISFKSSNDIWLYIKSFPIDIVERESGILKYPISEDMIKERSDICKRIQNEIANVMDKNKE